MNKRMTIVAALGAVTLALACNDKKFLTAELSDVEMLEKIDPKEFSIDD